MSIGSQVSFIGFSNRELVTALVRINREKYPDNYRACSLEIDSRKKNGHWLKEEPAVAREPVLDLEVLKQDWILSPGLMKATPRRVKPSSSFFVWFSAFIGWLVFLVYIGSSSLPVEGIEEMLESSRLLEVGFGTLSCLFLGITFSIEFLDQLRFAKYGEPALGVVSDVTRQGYFYRVTYSYFYKDKWFRTSAHRLRIGKIKKGNAFSILVIERAEAKFQSSFYPLNLVKVR